MANQVDIVIRAVDRASGEINKVTGAGNKLAAGFKSLTGFSLGAGAAMAAVGAGVKFLQQAVDGTVKYATEIDNMSRLLGISTEDTSRLVQASDDLFISQEKLASGLQAATRQGIDVSIDGLKKLSAQYLALPAGVERSEFVLKTFGRSGAEMGKLMEVGAEGIEAATAAIADNLVITEASMDAIISYKQSVDNLQDSWSGFKMAVGQEAIPALDMLLKMMTNGKDEIVQMELKAWRLENSFWGLSGAFKGNREEAALLRKQIAWLTGEYEKGEAGVSDFYKGISAMGGEVIPLTGELEGLGSAASTVAQYFSEMTTNMMFNKLAAGMDEEAAMALGVAMGLVNAETVFLSGAMDGLNAKYDTNKNGAIDATEMTKEYYEEVSTLLSLIEGAQSKTIVLTVRTSLDDQYGLWGQGSKNGYIGLAESNQASGGLGGGRTLVGEMGPEVVDLPPGSRVHTATNSAQTGTGGGGFTDRDLRKLSRYIAEEVARTSR